MINSDDQILVRTAADALDIEQMRAEALILENMLLDKNRITPPIINVCWSDCVGLFGSCFGPFYGRFFEPHMVGDAIKLPQMVYPGGQPFRLVARIIRAVSHEELRQIATDLGMKVESVSNFWYEVLVD